MITFSRVANIAPGKMPMAIEFAQRTAAYLKQTYGLDVAISVPIGGNPLQVCWTAQADNMAKFDELGQKFLTDKKYAAMITEYSDSMIPGTVVDSYWRTL
jgi:hypothetical protein